MLNIKLQFKYESVFYDSCEDSAVINVDNVNEAINEMDCNLNEFRELVYSYNFDDDKIQSWEYCESPNRIDENIRVTLSFNGKYKHFKNAYTFESYICKYFKNDAEVV